MERSEAVDGLQGEALPARFLKRKTRMNLTMHFRRFFLAIALVSLAVVTQRVQAAPVSMMLDVQGAVDILDGNSIKRAQIAATLQQGMRLLLASDATASLVHYASKQQYRITGPAELLIEPNAVRAVKGAAPTVKPLGDDKAQAAAGFRGRLVPAAYSMKEVLSPVSIGYPSQGEVVVDQTRPISIKSAEAGMKVTVGIYQGKSLVAEKALVTAAVSSIKFSELTTLQANTTYLLVVTDDTGSKKTVEFSLATPQAVKRIERIKPEANSRVDDWVLYALSLENEGALSLARDAWNQVAKRRPEAMDAVQHLTQ
jgi:hypothetical protein